jgi:hypothetical protein
LFLRIDMNQPFPATKLEALLAERILVLDGAMGTMIQAERLDESQYRGERFRDWPRELRGNNDLLCITRSRRFISPISTPAPTSSRPTRSTRPPYRSRTTAWRCWRTS